MGLTFAFDEYDRTSLENSVPVRHGGETLRVGPLELQIAYEFDIGALKDYDDGLHLYEVLGQNLNRTASEENVTKLGVEDGYEQLTGS